MSEPTGSWASPVTGPGSGWGAPPPATPSGWGAPPPAAPRPGVVPLRPLGLGELLDGAVGLVRGSPAATLGASALVATVSTLVHLVLLLTLLRPLFDIDAAALQAGDPEELLGLLTGAVGGLSVTALLGVVTDAVLVGCLSAVAGRAVLGQPFAFGDLRGALRGRLLRLVGAALLVQVAAVGPLLVAVGLVGLLGAAGGVGPAVVGGLALVPLAIALGGYLYVRLALAPSALVLEGGSVLGSFRRSGVLVRRSFWRILGVLLLTALVSVFAAQVLQLPFALLAGDGGPLSALSGTPEAPGTRALVLSAVGTGLASAVVSPFVAGVRALLYVDRRMRAEGLDVALQAAAGAHTSG